MGNVKVLYLSVLFLLLSSAFTSFNIKESTKNNFVIRDIETLDWLARVDSAGGSVSDSIIEAVDDYIKEVKGLKYQSLNIRSLILRENWYCGNFQAAFVPIFRSSGSSQPVLGASKDINHNYSASEYIDTGIAGGLKGNGVDRYLETGFIPSQVNELGLSDVHFMVYPMSDTTDIGRSGCRGGVEYGLYYYPKFLNGNTYFNINGNSDSYVAISSASGYKLIQRTSAQSLNVYSDSNLVHTAQSNVLNKPTTALTIGAFNNYGNVINFMSMRLGGYSIGKSFSQAQQLVHYNAVQRLMSRLKRITYSAAPLPPPLNFRSKQFTFTGNKLVINYETRTNGYLKFQLEDSGGNPVPGFTFNESDSITGNSLSREVFWSSGSNLSSLVNTPLYLRIQIDKADLYSLQFQNKIADINNSVPGFKAGSMKQFFADTLMFSGNIAATRVMHSPVKNPMPIISPTFPWEISPRPNERFLITAYSKIAHSMSPVTNKMVYKMWIRTITSFGNRVPVYFESDDGINWDRPNLETFKFNGNTNNNVMNDNQVYPFNLMTVIEDSARSVADSTRRYKSVYNTHFNGAADSKLNVSFSSDGINFVPYSGNPLRHCGEDLNSPGWIPALGKYVGYFRDSLGIRKIGRYVSDDWINWDYTGTILAPDALDPKTTNYYNMAVLYKDSVYWGFLGHFQLNAAGQEIPSPPIARTDNTVFIELLFSRDGINFVRCGNRQPFINIGTLGSWDDQMIFSMGDPIIIGNEFYFYYNGFNYKHMSNAPLPADGSGVYKSQIGLAKLGIDRFISLTVN